MHAPAHIVVLLLSKFRDRRSNPMGNVFEEGTALARHVKSDSGALQTKQLLDVCRSILPVVGERHGGSGRWQHSSGLPVRPST